MKYIIFSLVVALAFSASPVAYAWNIWSEDNTKIVGTLPDEAVREAQDEALRRGAFGQTTYPRGTIFHFTWGDDICPLWFPTFFTCVLSDDQ